MRFAVRFSAVRFPGIGMQPFAKCVSFDSGDTGDTPGVCPNTWVSLCVVRTRCARSRGVSAFVVDSPRSRSDANELSELPCLACAWDVLFGLLAEEWEVRDRRLKSGLGVVGIGGFSAPAGGRRRGRRGFVERDGDSP